MTNQELLFILAIVVGFLSSLFLIGNAPVLFRVQFSGVGAILCGIGSYLPEIFEPSWTKQPIYYIHSKRTLILLTIIIIYLIVRFSELSSLLFVQLMLGVLLHLVVDTIDDRLQSDHQKE